MLAWSNLPATFMRGIRYVNIPTTLLSMVDSSIGGKTGINLSNGKNLIGSIYHPEKIIIDPDILKTLPLREYHSGMAEIIKYGLILDKNLFEKLEENLDILLKNNQKSKILNEIIINCINLKINIVQQDEKDNNIRNILKSYFPILTNLKRWLGLQFKSPDDLSILRKLSPDALVL